MMRPRTRSRFRAQSASSDSFVSYLYSGTGPITPMVLAPSGHVLSGYFAGGSVPGDAFPYARTKRRIIIPYGQSLVLGTVNFAEDGSGIVFTSSNRVYFCRMPAGGLKAMFSTAAAAAVGVPGAAIAPFNMTPGWDSGDTGMYDDNLYGFNESHFLGCTPLTSALWGAVEFARDIGGVDPADNIWVGNIPGRGGLQIAGLIKPAPMWNVVIASVRAHAAWAAVA